MTPGTIHWVEFPGGAGRSQAGRRPAIIAQASAFTPRLPTIVLIPLTSQLEALRFPGTVLVERDADNGLRQHSVALVFQVTAIDKRFLTGRLGSVDPQVMSEITSMLYEILSGK